MNVKPFVNGYTVKRIITLSLSAILIITLFPTTGFAVGHITVYGGGGGGGSSDDSPNGSLAAGACG